jgi:hypothetical protein
MLFFLFAVAAGLWLYARPAGKKATVRRAPAAPPVVSTAPEVPTAALPPPRLAMPPKPPDAGRDSSPALPDEASLMRQIRALVKREPARAEQLAREARRRFPEGAEADERDSLLVDALINQQRIGRARDETYYYFDHHPKGRYGDHLSVMTGVHPRPGRKP